MISTMRSPSTSTAAGLTLSPMTVRRLFRKTILFLPLAGERSVAKDHLALAAFSPGTCCLGFYLIVGNRKGLPQIRNGFRGWYMGMAHAYLKRWVGFAGFGILGAAAVFDFFCCIVVFCELNELSIGGGHFEREIRFAITNQGITCHPKPNNPGIICGS